MDGEEGRDSDGRGLNRRAAPVNFLATTFRNGLCFRIHELVGMGADSLRTSLDLVRRLSLHTPIRRRVSAEDEQLALALDFAGDFDRLGDEIQDLFVHGLAVAGDEQKI